MENDNNNIGFENGNQQQFNQPQNGAEEQQLGQTQNGVEGQQFGQQQNTFSGQQFGQQQNTFSGQQFGQQQNAFAGQQFGQQNAYGQTPNYGMSMGPVDKKGQPMKNRFGMKLTFSILEILTLLSCNLLTGILGIIACVFSSKANTAYKESRWDDFKSAAKTSTICLWVGFAGFVIEVIVSIIFVVVLGYSVNTILQSEDYNYDDYDYSYNDTDSTYDYDTDSEEESEEESEAASETTTVTPSNVSAGTGITDPTITLNGTTITFPVAYTDFKAAGFSISADDEAYILNPGYYSSSITLYDANGNDIGYVALFDNSDAALSLAECMVYGVDLYYDSYYDAVGDVVLQNGVTSASTKEDIVTAYGEPDDLYESDSADSQDYTWYFHNDAYYDDYQNSVEISYWDGVIDEIEIRYMGWAE